VYNEEKFSEARELAFIQGGFFFMLGKIGEKIMNV